MPSAPGSSSSFLMNYFQVQAPGLGEKRGDKEEPEEEETEGMTIHDGGAADGDARAAHACSKHTKKICVAGRRAGQFF